MKEGRTDSPPPPRRIPGEFQRKTLWAAITGAAMLGIAAMAVYVVKVVADVLQFLQPVLVPVAFAGILAYLLEPLVQKLVSRGAPRFRAMMWVWVGFHGVLLLLFLSVAVPTISQGARFVGDQGSAWIDGVGRFVGDAVDGIDKVWERVSGPAVQNNTPAPPVEAEPSPENPVPAPDAAAAPPANGETPGKKHGSRVKQWLAEHGEDITRRLMSFLGAGFKGFLGMFGYLIGFLLVPLYLYYFLKESAAIQKNWSNYLPLRSSNFKAEVVDCLTEINGYLIAFFRGQMLVSMIDGLLVGISLMIIGLPYAMLIGVFVALLGLVPYVGNLICWLGAILISIAHFGKTGADGELVNSIAWLPKMDLWVYPLIVTILFVVVQQINSLVTAPKIVGDAVGLHPLTVIFSVLFWSLLIGGLLGALLAVPLTASLKVIFRRYFWERRAQLGRSGTPAAGSADGTVGGPEGI